MIAANAPFPTTISYEHSFIVNFPLQKRKNFRSMRKERSVEFQIHCKKIFVFDVIGFLVFKFSLIDLTSSSSNENV